MLPVEIPLFSIQRNPNEHPPTQGDIESGIIHTIRTMGEEEFTADGFTALSHLTFKQHHPGPMGKVVWFIEGDKFGVIPPWTRRTWWKFARSVPATRALENHIFGLQEENPMAHYYMVKGFLEPGTPVDTSVFYDRGGMTQNRKHGHVYESFSVDQFPADNYLGDNARDITDASIVMNATGEAMNRIHESLLEGFGKKFTFHQSVDRKGNMIWPRTGYAFTGLRNALMSILKLQDEAEKHWQENTKRAAAILPDLPWVPDFPWDNRFPPLPTFSVFFANQFDRQAGDVDTDLRIWVTAFQTAGPQQMFADRPFVARSD